MTTGSGWHGMRRTTVQYFLSADTPCVGHGPSSHRSESSTKKFRRTSASSSPLIPPNKLTLSSRNLSFGAKRTTSKRNRRPEPGPRDISLKTIAALSSSLSQPFVSPCRARQPRNLFSDWSFLGSVQVITPPRISQIPSASARKRLRLRFRALLLRFRCGALRAGRWRLDFLAGLILRTKGDSIPQDFVYFKRAHKKIG